MEIDTTPRVSVIIPTRNRLPLLKKALKSVEEQTFGNLEIIVVDDASDDDTAEFLREEMEKGRLRVIRHESRAGGGKARNSGILAAKGDFIAFLDDDDEWLPKKLEKQLPLFDDPQVGLVYTGTELVQTDHQLSYYALPDITGHVFETMLIENRIGTTNTVVLRAALARETLFDESLPARQDYDLWLRIAKTHKFAGVREALVKVYSRKTLSRITSNVENYVEAINTINRKYSDDISRLSAGRQRQRMAEQHFFLASQALKANNLRLSRSYYRKSFSVKFSLKAFGAWGASFFGTNALLQLRKLKG